MIKTESETKIPGIIKPDLCFTYCSHNAFTDLKTTDDLYNGSSTQEFNRDIHHSILWHNLCNYFNAEIFRAEVFRAYDGDYITYPTEEFLLKREVRIVGITNNCIIFQLELFSKNTWLVLFDYPIDDADNDVYHFVNLYN